jgi:hypothetical protein
MWRAVCIIFIGCWLQFPAPAFADQVYQQPAEFLKEVFNGAVPSAALLDVTGERRDKVAAILDHQPNYLRMRYWRSGERSAWVLEEIGKVKPITAGIIVSGEEIEDVRILIYRESHGGEVRHRYFTKQFVGAKLEPKLALSKNVDGISGATLSVNAIRRLARVALYLHNESGKS